MGGLLAVPAGRASVRVTALPQHGRGRSVQMTSVTSGAASCAARDRAGQGAADERRRRGRRSRGAPARSAATRGQQRPGASRCTSGATRRRRRSSSPTAAWTSPAPTTCSRRSSPTPGGGSCRGTTAATATPSTPRCTAGRPTSATRCRCSTPSRRRRRRSSATPRAGASCSSWPTPCPTASATSSTSTACPSRRSFPDVADHQRTKLLAAGAHRLARPPAQARQRAAQARHDRGAGRPRGGRMNPRLSEAWLQYLVTVGAREDADGWRWKIDPTMRFGGFGPWRPEWSMMRLPDIGVPVLAMLGTEADPMGWGTPPEDVLSAPAARRPARDRRGRRPLRPHRAARTRSPSSCWSTSRDATTVRLQHNRIALALHELRAGDGPAAAAPARPGRALAGGGAGAPGRVAGPGVGARPHRSRRLRRGRRRRLLLRGADGRRRHRAGPPRPGDDLRARPRRLRRPAGRRRAARAACGARSCFDGPGLAGGGPWPASPFIPLPSVAPPPGGTPDPWAILELTRDVRPPDYAASFARQAAARSGPRRRHRGHRREPPALARGRRGRARRDRVLGARGPHALRRRRAEAASRSRQATNAAEGGRARRLPRQ